MKDLVIFIVISGVVYELSIEHLIPPVRHEIEQIAEAND